MNDIAAVTGRLADLSRRMLRFEDVSEAELAEFEEARDALCRAVPTEEDRT